MGDLVVITQPYVPAYRVPLFDAVADKLAVDGIELRVYSGRPKGKQARRGDNSSGPWHYRLRSFDLPVGRWRLALRYLPHGIKPSLVVSELESLNLFAWMRVARGRPTILWGHGKPYVSSAGGLSDRIEAILASRSSHVMTYAPSGRDYLIQRGGLKPSLVTSIGNSTDSETLRRRTLELIRDVPSRRTGSHALYVGGLDASKRIDFLLAAAFAARRSNPRFELTIIGRGADEGVVRDAAADFDWIRHIEVARGDQLADLAFEADALWVPGRVGLVAVDALAVGLPVHTTRFAFHAPEIEFLKAGEVVFLPDDAERFAQDSLRLMQRPPAPLRQDIPSIDSVASNIVTAIHKVLGRSG